MKVISLSALAINFARFERKCVCVGRATRVSPSKHRARVRGQGTVPKTFVTAVFPSSWES